MHLTRICNVCTIFFFRKLIANSWTIGQSRTACTTWAMQQFNTCCADSTQVISSSTLSMQYFTTTYPWGDNLLLRFKLLVSPFLSFELPEELKPTLVDPLAPTLPLLAPPPVASIWPSSLTFSFATICSSIWIFNIFTALVSVILLIFSRTDFYWIDLIFPHFIYTIATNHIQNSSSLWCQRLLRRKLQSQLTITVIRIIAFFLICKYLLQTFFTSASSWHGKHRICTSCYGALCLRPCLNRIAITLSFHTTRNVHFYDSPVSDMELLNHTG